MTRSLKISLAASALILTVASVVGWSDYQKLASSRARNARVVSQAQGLGISIDPSEESLRITKRAREPRDAEDRLTVTELLAGIRKMDEIEKNGGNSDKAGRALLARMMSLSPGCIEILIAELRTTEDLPKEARWGLLGVLLVKLSADNPQAVLKMLPELEGSMGELSQLADEDETRRMREYLLTNSLASWGRKDPMASVAWLLENQTKFADSINDSVKCSILSGVVSLDPVLALKLIDETGIKEKALAVTAIARGAKTNEQRSATLAALRAQPDGFVGGATRDTMRSAIQELASGAFKGGFESASKWLESAKLDPAEMAAAGSCLEFHQTQGETGAWMVWLGKNLPADQAGEPIAKLMTRWTEIDYQAAGKWLGSAPEGRAKSLSIQAYATAVSKREPETAAQWAMTLPAGQTRDATLGQIYQNWPKEDSAARDAFAKAHGIE